MSDPQDRAPGAGVEPPARELTGGCHCGAVRYRVRTRARRVDDCNCSICHMKAFLHLIVEASEFELVSGAESLSEYRFGTGIARHTFCSRCGVHPFYTPRSHPTGVSVNARSIDGYTPSEFEIVPFDGQNWEANVARIQ